MKNGRPRPHRTRRTPQIQAGTTVTPKGRSALRPLTTTLRLLLSLGLVLLSPGAQQFALAHLQPAQAGYEAAVERIDTVVGVVEGLREEIDRTLFEADELAFELAFEDAETITAWVGENIAYQPYRGLLRGADGVLMTGAGNSLDQAVLLARLLGDAGYEVRLALGELDEERARDLLASASRPQLGGDVARSLEEFEAQLALLADLPGMDPQLFRDSLEQLLLPPRADPETMAEAQETASELTDVLRANGIELGDDAVYEQLLDEASEYAWVEYRFSAQDEWQQAHPLLEGAPELEAGRHLDDEIPAELLHRVRIEVVVERKSGDDLEAVPVMSPWERPAANAWGTVLTYSNLPSAMSAGREDEVMAVLEESDFFYPQWNGSMAPGAQAFDLEGNLLSPDVAGHDAAGVFKTVNTSMQSAVGALGALGDTGSSGDVQALTAQWIEYTLIAPGGEETNYRRVVFDRVGADARSEGGVEPLALTEEEAALSLLSEQRIMVFPGSPRPEYLLDLYLARLVDSRPFLEYTAAVMHGVEPELSIDQALSEASPLEHLLTVRAFDAGIGQEEGRLSYRAQPSLLVYSSGLRGAGDEAVSFTSLDIVHNARRTLRREGDRLVAASSDALQHGVWETIVERELVDPQGQGWNTTLVLDEAVAGGAGLAVLEPGADVREHGFSGRAAENLQRDLERGYAVVVAQEYPDGVEPAWWRIDPTSGETLGITADGRGQTMTEYTIKLYNDGLSLMFTVKGISDCMDNHTDDPIGLACCLVKGQLNNVIGGGLGGALGAGFGRVLVGPINPSLSREVTGMFELGFGVTSGALDTDLTGIQC